MEEIVLSAEDIARIVERLGADLTRDLANEERPPVFLCVMKGALPFYSDLIKQVNLPIVCDYLQISSYGGGMSSSGSITMAKDIATDLDGRTVVVVEDIVDTGLSISYLVNHIQTKFKPKKVLVCALFDKVLARKVNVKVDYAGTQLPDAKFLVGYGLDYRQLGRNVPYVFVPTKDEIEVWDKLEV